MKLSRIVAAIACGLVVLTSCGPRVEEGPKGDGTGFKVTASASVIYANGSDAVVFTPLFDGLAIDSSTVTAYNAEDGNIVALEGLTFVTEITGSHKFYFTHTNAQGNHTSETLEVIAIEKPRLDFGDIEQKGLTITPTTTIFQIGVEDAVLIVRRDGKVLDAVFDDEVTFFDATNNEPIPMTTKKMVDDNGTEMLMYCYAPKSACIRSIWASCKTLNTKAKPIKMTAVEEPIPAPAIDVDEDNTSFKRRSLLLQLTGTACPNCPRLMEVIEDLRENDKYADKFVHVGVHTYNGSDPMYYKESGFVSAIGGVDSYPAFVFDFRYSAAHSQQTFHDEIDEAQASPAKAGIAARIQTDGVTTALARVTVKAAEQGEYCLGAMLVESNIVAVQQGDQTGKFKVHENALRKADGKNNGYYIGHSLGTLEAGETADYLFNLPLDSKWNVNNCHIVFYVTTPSGEKGSYEVTNAIASESLNCTVQFDYK